MVLPGGHIRYTCKRVVGDDRLDDRVERRNVCNRVREFADRTLGYIALYEICHCFLWLPPLGPWAKIVLCRTGDLGFAEGSGKLKKIFIKFY